MNFFFKKKKILKISNYSILVFVLLMLIFIFCLALGKFSLQFIFLGFLSLTNHLGVDDLFLYISWIHVNQLVRRPWRLQKIYKTIDYLRTSCINLDSFIFDKHTSQRNLSYNPFQFKCVCVSKVSMCPFRIANRYWLKLIYFGLKLFF